MYFRGELPDVAQPVSELFHEAAAGSRDIPCPDLHEQERHEDCQEAQAVDEEADPLTAQTDEDPGQRRTDEPGAVEQGGVQRDGVSQVVLVLEHLHDERMPHRHVEGIHETEKEGEHEEMPDLDRPRQGEDGQDQGLQHGQDLGGYEKVVPVHAVRIDAGQGRHKQHGDLAGKPYDAQGHGGPGHPVHEPAHGGLLHPCADQGHTLAAEEKPVVPGSQGSQQGSRPAAVLMGCHRIWSGEVPDSHAPASISPRSG